MIGERPIQELAKALALAQAEIKHAEKSAENPAFKRDGKTLRYATLADVWDACREPLTKHGLSVVQSPSRAEHGVSVTTLLMHTSGQWLESTLEVPVGGGTAQAFGSAITYARRYSLAAIVGIAPDEDDDGNAASVSAPRGSYERREPERKVTPRARPQEPDANVDENPDNAAELRAECERLSKKVKGHLQVSLAEMRKRAKVSTSGTLSPVELDRFVKWCQARLAELEDPEPSDDAPGWMLTPEEGAP